MFCYNKPPLVGSSTKYSSLSSIDLCGFQRMVLDIQDNTQVLIDAWLDIQLSLEFSLIDLAFKGVKV